MPFEFVDNSNIDAKTRKKIRSQVMLGKNAGKKKDRVKYERKKLATLTSKPIVSATGSSSESVISSDDEIVDWAVAKAATYRYWNDYSMYNYPRELEWQMRRALHYFMLAATDIMYPKELCYDISCPYTAFFDLFQTSEAFFHCFVGISEGMRCIITNVEAPTELSLRSLANTYRCINTELETSTMPSWGAIASVMSLVMHENLFGMVGKSALHLRALERMVDLKGGLAAIEGRIALLHKICRSDMEYSLQTGSRPRFVRDAWPREDVERALTKAHVRQTATPDLLDATISEVFDDFIDVCQILNTEEIDDSQKMIDGKIRPRMRATSFQEVLISILYRLLHAYPLASNPPIHTKDNACYLSMIALVSTMMIRGSPKHLQYYQLLRRRLLDAINALDDEDKEFKFWVYFTGGVSIFDNHDDWLWLAPQMKHLASQLNIVTLLDARLVLLKYPWVRFFHDESCGPVFWNLFSSGGKSPSTAANRSLLCQPYCKSP